MLSFLLGFTIGSLVTILIGYFINEFDYDDFVESIKKFSAIPSFFIYKPICFLEKKLGFFMGIRWHIRNCPKKTIAKRADRSELNQESMSEFFHSIRNI